MPDTEIEKLAAARTDRRRFMNMGLAGLGMLGVNHLSVAAQDPAPPALTDTDIFNFALNLEYLEAEYYLRAAFGRGLSDTDVTGGEPVGAVFGGRVVPFETPAIERYAQEIASDEEAHVKFLRSALGFYAVARPTIDLGTSFITAARAAGIIGPDQSFDPFANENNFLLGAFIFEDVGVTAYKGAARLIQNKDFLEYAAGILAVEAYHASTVRTVLLARGQSDPSLIDAVQKISELRDAADGSADLDQGIVLNGKANLVPTDDNGLAFSRTAAQVLNIVYLGGAGARFGFFPNGLNGVIR